jgi:single-stranded-DNA-specific exonuclease
MTPIFMTDNLKDTGYGKCVGEDKTHLRFTATQSNLVTERSRSPKFVCIGFNLGEKLNLIKDKQPFSAVYSVDENHWQGNVSLQLKIRDIKG